MPIQILSPDQIRVIGFVGLFVLVAPLFPFLYLVLRWRVDGPREPGVGTYGALLYFRAIAVLLLLAGSANLVYGWMSTTDVEPALERMSWGMFVGSLLFLLLNVGLLRLHGPQPDLGAVRRVFAGFLLVLCGLVAFTAIVYLFVTVFEEVDPDKAKEVERRVDELRIWGSWTAHFLAAYVVGAWRLSRTARKTA